MQPQTVGSHGIRQQQQREAQCLLTRLRAFYPEARCALNFTTPLELLIATILSAQCTDERVNRVTPALFGTYHTAADYATADMANLTQAIRSTGFYQQKARSIQQCCAALVQDHAGIVPTSMAALVRLPGVGRKTANVVLGNALHRPQGIAVDTHVKRLAQRLGLTTATSADAIEQDLLPLIPQSMWTSISHILITHGRTVCKARTPQCHRCPVVSLCPSSRQSAPPCVPVDG